MTGDFPTCISVRCPICNPVPTYTLPPVPILQPRGCICPPTSEATCQSPSCPRKA